MEVTRCPAALGEARGKWVAGMRMKVPHELSDGLLGGVLREHPDAGLPAAPRSGEKRRTVAVYPNDAHVQPGAPRASNARAHPFRVLRD